MSVPYGMPSSPPPGPSAPTPKSRTGLYIAIACGCLLLATLLVAAVGVGLWLFSRDDGGEDPAGGPSTSQSPAEDPTTTDDQTSEAPTDDPTSDSPIETPTEDPSDAPTSGAGTSFSIHVSAPEEGTTLDTDDETLETENGKFIGVAVTLTNNGTEDIGLSGSRFQFYDSEGQSHPLRYASFSTSGPQIAPDEEATALLYADVPEDMVLETISYTDAVGTDGQELTFPVG